MTDNGSSMKNKGVDALRKAYPSWQPNAGMRGYKNDIYEGSPSPFVY